MKGSETEGKGSLNMCLRCCVEHVPATNKRSYVDDTSERAVRAKRSKGVTESAVAVAEIDDDDENNDEEEEPDDDGSERKYWRMMSKFYWTIPKQSTSVMMILLEVLRLNLMTTFSKIKRRKD